MAVLQDPAGATLTAAQAASRYTVVPQVTQVVMTQTIWETYQPEGTNKGHGKYRRPKFAIGRTYPKSEIDAYFAAGSGPTITTVSPASLAVAGNTLVTVKGTNLDKATGVTVGGTAGTAMQIISPNELRFRSPAKAAATGVPVVVTGVPADSAAKNVTVA
jgi:hypothetical protein